MDELGFYIPFNSSSVIAEQWKGEYEGLCAMKHCLGSERISPSAEFQPESPSFKARSANRSNMQNIPTPDRISPSTQSLANYVTFCKNCITSNR